MNIFIMAQGRQTRMKDLGYPKQCIQVGGERLIDRTARLFGPATVICGPELRSLIEGNPRFRFFKLERPGDCILQGLQAFQGAWDTGVRTLILLGDVYYSEDAARKIIDDTRDTFFAGEPVIGPGEGELFALSFRNTSRMAGFLARVPCLEPGRVMMTQGTYQSGHLRNLLWEIQGGMNAAPDKTSANYARPELHLPISDETCDFDDPWDLKQAKQIEDARRQA